MIVEFVGCTGAGKTTVADAVVRRLRGEGWVVRDHCRRRSTMWVSLGDACVTPLCLLTALRGWPHYPRFLRVVWGAMQARGPGPLWTLARATAAVRLLGTHAWRTRYAQSVIRVVDEGLFGTAHLAFLALSPPLAPDLALFAATIPLPDVIVLVDAPVDILVQRALTRSDPPRELRGRSSDFVRACLANVQAAFAGLAQAPRVAPRVIPAWNPTLTPAEREREADRITTALRARLN